MNHLSDEQISALLDDALPAGERAALDAHLAGCDACRARLAELSALDESLGEALTHDPGEGYFADFADRVSKRIAAGGSPPAPEPRRSLWSWLTSPRGLALAGSTAALLVTAGVAWMRFHNEQDVARALHEAAPNPPATRAPETTAPGESNELAPAPPALAPPSTDQPARADAAGPPRGAAHMERLRTLPNGEQVPEPRPQEQAGARQSTAPATGSTLAQMKKRSIAPAAEGGAAAGAAAPSMKTESAPREEEKDARAPHPATEDFAAPAPSAAPPSGAPSSAAAPAAAKLAREPAAAMQKSFATDTARGQSFSAWGATKALHGGNADEFKAGASHPWPERDGMEAGRSPWAREFPNLVVPCGKVRDSRGHPLAGAQITVVHDGVRTARTGPDGSFCVDGLKPGDTLTVMHVGFEPWTVVMTPTTLLAVRLEPVGTLGPNSTMLTAKPQASPSLSGAMRAHANVSADSARAPAPDVYVDQSFGIRQLVRDAREATAVASREHTAPAFENAAKQWATVARQVKGAPAYDASFQYVHVLREAYQLEPTGERAGRLRSAMTAFLAIAPASLPERATVERWQAELNAPSSR